MGVAAATAQRPPPDDEVCSYAEAQSDEVHRTRGSRDAKRGVIKWTLILSLLKIFLKLSRSRQTGSTIQSSAFGAVLKAKIHDFECWVV